METTPRIFLGIEDGEFRYALSDENVELHLLNYGVSEPTHIISDEDVKIGKFYPDIHADSIQELLKLISESEANESKTRYRVTLLNHGNLIDDFPMYAETKTEVYEHLIKHYLLENVTHIDVYEEEK